MTITASEIRDAAETLDGQVVRTPFVRSGGLNDALAADIFLKLETLQRTRSFKYRSAFVKLKQVAQEKNNGIIEITAGNQAQGVTYHAQRLGIAATIVMPKGTPFEDRPNPRIRCARRSRSRFRQRCQTICRRSRGQSRTCFVHFYPGYAHHRRIRNHRTENAG